MALSLSIEQNESQKPELFIKLKEMERNIV